MPSEQNVELAACVPRVLAFCSQSAMGRAADRELWGALPASAAVSAMAEAECDPVDGRGPLWPKAAQRFAVLPQTGADHR